MKIVKSLLVSLLLWSGFIYAEGLEKVFYLTPDDIYGNFNIDQIQLIEDHKQSIDILAPQIYQLNESGDISGNIDIKLLSLAKKNNIKIMPLVMNSDFDQAKLHAFLNNPFAQNHAIDKMVNLCQINQFYGIQFDFESIHVSDKEAFTHFFKLAAKKMHQHGFAMSVAVVPRISNTIDTAYDEWFFNNWSGAYDYKALSESADFISLMSYDEHNGLTTPGPIAGLDWVKNTIQYLLKDVPPEKISVGVATYSGYWATRKLDPGNIPEKFTFRPTRKALSYTSVQALIKHFHPEMNWDKVWQINYGRWTHNGKTEYLFIEDAKSFRSKLKLAKRYHLRGISVWKLGFEDPNIWNN
jgi:spore germination protein